ncbi:MAG: MFS transporter [Cyanobacteria bacterium]|nr:MFS transporter [Cyanobacteriota bacterium]
MNPDSQGEKKSTLLMSGKELTVLFAVAYLSHGIATQFGLVSQPLQYFMMKGLNLTAAQVSSYLAVMMLPWVLKPFYGLVCDFFPLLGYRRRSYAIAFNAITIIAFIVMASASSLPLILAAFVFSSVGMAASTAVFVGVAVESGRKEGKHGEYFSLQTFCYYSALVVASIGGGWLCHTLEPLMAVHTAACIAALPVVVVVLLSFFLLKEQKCSLDRAGIRETCVSLRQILGNRSLLLVALFILCWDLSPSFGVPLYFYESKTLGFEQSFIGQLAAWNAAGMAVGAFIYRRWLKDLTLTRQLCLAVALGTGSVLGYLLLSTPISAVILEVCRGVCDMFYILTMYALAAAVCPPRSEVTVMAALLAVKNLAVDGSTFIGGQLFSNVFDNQLAPLIVVAAITTALCALLIPSLRKVSNDAAQKAKNDKQ